MSKIVGLVKGHFNFEIKSVAKSVIVGALAGLVAVFYRLMFSSTEKITKAFKVFIGSDVKYLAIWAIVLLVCATLVWLVIRFEKSVGGGGVAQAKAELTDKLDANFVKVIIGKIVAGGLANIAGLSLGNEGPSVQLGAMTGKGFAKITKQSDVNKKLLISSGASAGLAAAFNAPLAGVLFALEELNHNFSEQIMFGAITASVTADFVSRCVFGLEPVFDLGTAFTMPLKSYWLLIIVGIILGLIGTLYNLAMKGGHKLYGKIKSDFVRMLIPFVVAGVLIIILPQALGSGHSMLEEVLEGNFVIGFLLIIFAVKFIFSMVSFCSGVSGGIFLPMLSMGALLGKICGDALVSVGVIEQSMVINFVLLGMVGFFTAIVRAPVTGIVLICEMTGSFSHILPLSLVAVVAYFVAQILKSKPVYEYLYERLNSKSTDDFDKEKVLIDVDIYLGSELHEKNVKDIVLHNDCLIVSIKRDDMEIIPRGNTKVYYGDKLTVVTSRKNASVVREELTAMCQPLTEE